MRINQRNPNPVPLVKRFRGCLLGAAVGDALGMPVENMTRSQIQEKYGDRINCFYPKPNRRLVAGQWTDDTLLTQATVDSLLRMKALVPSDIAWNFKLAFLRERNRGFGATTRQALTRIAKNYMWHQAGVDGGNAAGNGAAMRIAPVALFSYSNLEQLRRNCTLAASITHKNQEAINGSLAIACVIARIINGTFEKKTIVEETMAFVGHSKVSDKMKTVNDLLIQLGSIENALTLIGTSGSVFDTVGSSLYFFLRFSDSFSDALVNSVSYGGDTDTIAAIVGAMSGALHGEDAIPVAWRNGVEAGENILEKAEALCRVSHGV